MNGFVEIQDLRGTLHFINTKYIVRVTRCFVPLKECNLATQITIEGEIHIKTFSQYERVIKMIRSANNGCN